MPDITFTQETLRYISLFENITKTRVRDCLETEDKLVFVVEPGHANRAVGKGGENVIKLKNTTGKNIQVIEYSDDPENFIRNVFYAYNVQKVEIENRGSIVHATVTVDPKVKGRAIGKNGRNLRIARGVVNRHHNIQSISVA
jgi:transcription termination/antitermination protein NusA